MSKADKMYKNSPKLERDEKDGKMKSVKPSEKEKEAVRTEEGTEGMAIHEEGMSIPARHALERYQMHSKQELEHSTFSGKDKKEVYARHLKEMAALHKKHQEELSKKIN